MKRVAVLGANGFIGTRTTEILSLGGAAEVIPVVRRRAGLGEFSRLGLTSRIADAFDHKALTTAFSGCHAVISLIAGAPDVISGTIKPMYRAAERAGVHRLVYLSSAAVHGQSPAQGTDEETPLSEHQPIAYNNAKVQAEHALQRLRRRGPVELVILRPGIVFGPRSAWVSRFADALLAGNAYLTNDGEGICNSIYVDNLVHAIELALKVDGINGEAFLVGDKEKVRWRDLYQPIAEALGFNLDDVPRVAHFQGNRLSGSLNPLGRFLGQSVLSKVSAKLRQAVSAGATSVRNAASDPSRGQSGSLPRATLEMSLLYDCRYKLPNDKASKLLGYEPVVSFDAGRRKTVGWLSSVGYRVPHLSGQ